MVESINSSQSLNLAQMLQMQQRQMKPPSAEDMFQKLTADLGGDGETITKDQLELYISELEESDGTDTDKGKLGFLKQLASNFDEISGGDDSITVDELKENMELLKPPKGGPQGPPPGIGMQGETEEDDDEETLWWEKDDEEDDSSTNYTDLLESFIDVRV